MTKTAPITSAAAPAVEFTKTVIVAATLPTVETRDHEVQPAVDVLDPINRASEPATPYQAFKEPLGPAFLGASPQPRKTRIALDVRPGRREHARVLTATQSSLNPELTLSEIIQELLRFLLSLIYARILRRLEKAPRLSLRTFPECCPQQPG